MGIDLITSAERFTFGFTALADGIHFVPVLIGLFAIAELLEQSERLNVAVERIRMSVVRLPSLADYKSTWKSILAASGLGTFIGILPAEGSSIASLISYNEAKRWSANRDEFGNGALEGIAAPEAANNAATGGAMVPTLALGIPGGSVTAVILVGLLAQGVRPGPHLFAEQPTLLYSLFVAMFAANVVCFAFCMLGAKLWSQITLVPTTFLWPSVFVLAVVGSYSLAQSMFHVITMVAAGGAGYLMRRYGYSPVPLVIGLLLGGMAESRLKQSLLMFDGNWLLFLGRPLALLLIALTLVAIFAPAVLDRMRRQKLPADPE